MASWKQCFPHAVPCKISGPSRGRSLAAAIIHPVIGGSQIVSTKPHGSGVIGSIPREQRLQQRTFIASLARREHREVERRGGREGTANGLEERNLALEFPFVFSIPHCAESMAASLLGRHRLLDGDSRSSAEPVGGTNC
jgi:hypothetical protein